MRIPNKMVLALDSSFQNPPIALSETSDTGNNADRGQNHRLEKTKFSPSQEIQGTVRINYLAYPVTVFDLILILNPNWVIYRSNVLVSLSLHFVSYDIKFQISKFHAMHSKEKTIAISCPH